MHFTQRKLRKTIIFLKKVTTSDCGFFDLIKFFIICEYNLIRKNGETKNAYDD